MCICFSGKNNKSLLDAIKESICKFVRFGFVFWVFPLGSESSQEKCMREYTKTKKDICIELQRMETEIASKVFYEECLNFVITVCVLTLATTVLLLVIVYIVEKCIRVCGA